MNLKKIQAMPFAPFRRESMERWRVTVKEPVVDGERLLVVDFLENLSCTAYRRDMPSFRIVCAKKSREVKGINHEGRIQQKVLNCFSTPMWWYNEYVLISPREEEALRRFLKAEKTENHQMDNLCKWIKQTRQEMKKRSMEKRGELMDEDYRLCPEALPEGLIDYIRREVLPEDRVAAHRFMPGADVLRRAHMQPARTAVQGLSAFWRTAVRLPQITLKISLRCRRGRTEKRCSSGNDSCIGITRQDGSI